MTTWTITDPIRELSPSEFITLDADTAAVYRERIAVDRAERKAADKAAKAAKAKAAKARAKDPAVIAHNASMAAKADAIFAAVDADPEIQAYRAAQQSEEDAFLERNARLASYDPQAALRQRLARSAS